MSFSSMTSLFPGDLVQLDKGTAMVEAVGTSTADCIDTATGKVRTCPHELPKHLVLKRGGRKALEDFLNKRPDVKRSTEAALLTHGIKPTKGTDTMKLELGDELMLDGRRHCCTAVTDKRATLTDYNGASQELRRYTIEEMARRVLEITTPSRRFELPEREQPAVKLPARAKAHKQEALW